MFIHGLLPRQQRTWPYFSASLPALKKLHLLDLLNFVQRLYHYCRCHAFSDKEVTVQTYKENT